MWQKCYKLVNFLLSLLITLLTMLLLSSKYTILKFWSINLVLNYVNNIKATYKKVTKPIDKILSENILFPKN